MFILFLSLSHMTEDTQLVILISWVELLFLSEVGLISASHFKSSKSYLSVTLTSQLWRNHFHYEAVHGTTFALFLIYSPRCELPYNVVAHLGSTITPGGLISPSRRWFQIRPRWVIPSQALILLALEDWFPIEKLFCPSILLEEVPDLVHFLSCGLPSAFICQRRTPRCLAAIILSS